MLHVDDENLRMALERADDLFRLHRLSGAAEADDLATAVFANFGIDEVRRQELIEALARMSPIAGDPVAESMMTAAMCAGVLVGLLVAAEAMPHRAATAPDFPPRDL